MILVQQASSSTNDESNLAFQLVMKNLAESAKNSKQSNADYNK